MGFFGSGSIGKITESDLPSTVKEKLVKVNEIGDLSQLKTKNKSSLTASTNEVAEQLQNASNDMSSREINIMFPPSPLVGARGNNSDETSIIQNILNFAKANGYVTVYIPSGIFKCNLELIGNGITIKGAGIQDIFDSSKKGTSLIPADLTKPIITLGDGTTKTAYNDIKDLTLDGRLSLGVGGDYGLYIKGAEFCKFENLGVYRCKKDGIHITSSVTKASQLLTFNNLYQHYCGESAFYVEWGLSWVNGIWINNYYASTHEASTAYVNSKIMTIDSCSVYMNNTYIDVPNKENAGIEFKKTFENGLDPKMYGDNIGLDNLGYGNVVLNLECYLPNQLHKFFSGTNLVTNKGKIKFSDGTVYAPPEPFTYIGDQANGTNLGYSIVNGALNIRGSEYPMESPAFTIESKNNKDTVAKANKAGGIFKIQPGNNGYTEFYGGNYFMPLYFEFSDQKRFVWVDNNNFMRIKKVTNPSTERPAHGTDGSPLMPVLYGTTAQRPVAGIRFVGMMYFDTTLNKPIWRTSTDTWVDATGTTV